jgi:ankyrin repeat protein
LLAQLQAGENIDKTNKNGQTLLHYAAYNGDLELMKFAVENGADVNKKDKSKQPPAGYVAYNEHNLWLLFTYLADNGADLSVININGRPLISYAAMYAGPEEISMLIKQGISVHSLYYGTTPLFSVYNPHAAEKARVLIDAGADVNFKSENKSRPTPIFSYLYNSYDYEDILKLLINEGADIEVRNNDGNTPLLAAIFPNTAIILINSGADINVKNNEGDTCLLMTARHASERNDTTIELLKILIERGADKNAIGSVRKTAYDIALIRGFEAQEIEFLKP